MLIPKPIFKIMLMPKPIFKAIDFFFRGLKQLYLLNCENISKSKFLFCGKDVKIEYPFRQILGQKYIKIGNGTILHSGLYLGVYKIDDFDNPEILIAENCIITYNCQFTAINRISIGENALIGSNVIITDHNHGSISRKELDEIPVKRPLISKGPVIIGKNVWIGANSVILSNVTIGDNCIVGANSVLTKSFEANSVIAGNPAKLIKKL